MGDPRAVEGVLDAAVAVIRIGSKVLVSVLDPDPRCQAAPNPEILRKVARAHDGNAGVYGAVMGVIRSGDPVAFLD
jgi:hypothetical protein